MLTLRTHRAFTLLELMLVLAILGIAAGITFPASATMLKQAQARATAGRLASLLNSARAASLASGTPKTVVFDKERHRAEMRNGTRFVQLPDWLAFDSLEGFITPAPGEAELDGQKPLPPHCVIIVFLPDGTTEPATIRIGSPNGRFRITVTCPSFGRCATEGGR